ncbi:32309_t:CDS:2 [Gigaspora margarita]|uniref:32309_t:CDS:1 n=1 Tax=Gigaspora margarita TaxID=4874 RepID=A0ABN7WHR1_GIGMA|nr:32309_t:CDS:2 [Gigaspora margarita]
MELVNYDFALVRFEFNQGDAKLQDFTGLLVGGSIYGTYLWCKWGPFISQYDSETNLGYVYALMCGVFIKTNVSFSSNWDENRYLPEEKNRVKEKIEETFKENFKVL